jgi:hypothetical protein
MFVVVVEGVERPKMLVRSIGRPYLVKKQVHRSGEGGLYRFELRNGRATIGYKIIPFLPHGKVSLDGPRHRSHNTAGEVIERPPQVVDGISDDQRQEFRDWFRGAISQCKPGWLRLGRFNVRLDPNRMPILAQGAGASDKLVNVLIGPLNL